MLKYNGWVNRETWLVNVWLGDMLSEMQEEGQEITAEFIRDMIDEMAGDLRIEGIMLDMLNGALSVIDYRELEEFWRGELEDVA
jgi:hypothetical protein